MSLSIQPTEDNALAALRAFLVAVVPADCPVSQAQPNRVPEPDESNFVLMTPRSRTRLATNRESFVDAAFVASIAGTAMTVTEVDYGELAPGRVIFGLNVGANTRIVSGPGGPGAYVVDTAQTVASEEMACGVTTVEQSTEYLVQIDVHGPLSGDIAQTISTMFRSMWGVDQFAGQSPNYGVVPLYADDPKQLPFSNDQQQVENRWMVEARMQINPVVTAPQQFAEALEVGLVDVDERYPASP